LQIGCLESLDLRNHSRSVLLGDETFTFELGVDELAVHLHLKASSASTDSDAIHLSLWESSENLVLSEGELAVISS